jgi:uncharacterized Rmd1/YagE family protein
MVANQSSRGSRCVSYATALSYPVKDITRMFRAHHRVSSFREVIFVHFREDEEEAEIGAFIFGYGTVVMWGLTNSEEEEVLTMLRSHQEGAYENPEREIMAYSYGKKAGVVDDCIILPTTNFSAKLAFSHGLAQSVKLAVFEGIVKKTIDTTRAIPVQLSRHGRIPLSKKEIQRKIGELFIERSSINLHFDVLDVPEYFWEHSDLEPLYTIIATHLDLETRVEVLNRRLDIIHDLFEVLSNELNHQHASRLEWIIIILILIEVALSLLKDFL